MDVLLINSNFERSGLQDKPESLKGKNSQELLTELTLVSSVVTFWPKRERLFLSIDGNIYKTCKIRIFISLEEDLFLIDVSIFRISKSYNI